MKPLLLALVMAGLVGCEFSGKVESKPIAVSSPSPTPEPISDSEIINKLNKVGKRHKIYIFKDGEDWTVYFDSVDFGTGADGKTFGESVNTGIKMHNKSLDANCREERL